jgi:hypothetical protein
MTEPIKNGIDVLRATLRSRNRSPHALSMIAGDVPNVGTTMLESFAAGKADLSVEALQALAKSLYPHGEYDPETRMLRPANKEEPRPLCRTYPQPFDPKSSPYYTPIAPGVHLPGPQPVKKEKLQAKPKGRPGWLGGCW